MKRLLALLLAAGAVSALAPSVASALSPPVAQCATPGDTSGSCDRWFTGDVTVTWSFDPAGVTATDCNVVTISSDTQGTRVRCRVWYGSDDIEAGKVIRRDATPPQVTAAVPERDADANGWYNRPVAITFSGVDATSGIASCTQATYEGPDSAAAAVAGTCTDAAGNTSSPASFPLRYDATPPTVAVSAGRRPDANGWYSRPLAVRFSAVDATSGPGSCDAPVRFAGPDSAAASVSGTCSDAAGNVGAPAVLAIRYDSTPPAPAAVAVAAGDGQATVTWKGRATAEAFEVVRTPGLGGQKRSVVYRGRARSFVDRRVTNGVRYRYEVLSFDRARNAARALAVALPLPPVYAPLPGAVVSGPPLVKWKPVKKARFYNLQLYAGDRKLLTTWPMEARLRLPASWTFAGTLHRLGNGRYRVYVWPAFGTRAKPRYGKLLGQVDFVVRRRAALTPRDIPA